MQMSRYVVMVLPKIDTGMVTLCRHMGSAFVVHLTLNVTSAEHRTILGTSVVICAATAQPNLVYKLIYLQEYN